jgi:hypothetical protein
VFGACRCACGVDRESIFFLGVGLWGRCGLRTANSCVVAGLWALSDRSLARVPTFYRQFQGFLANVGFVGMVHYFWSRKGTRSRGRLRGPKRRKPLYLAGLQHFRPGDVMALVGAFRVALSGGL